MSRLPAHPLCPLFLSAFSTCCVACGMIHSAVKLNVPHGYITLTFINYLCCITIIRSRTATCNAPALPLTSELTLHWPITCHAQTEPGHLVERTDSLCCHLTCSCVSKAAVAAHLLFAVGHSTVSCGHSGALLMLAAHKASCCRPRTLHMLTAYKASCCRQLALTAQL